MELNATTAEVIAALCNAEVDIIALLANWLDHDLVWELFLDVHGGKAQNLKQR